MTDGSGWCARIHPYSKVDNLKYGNSGGVDRARATRSLADVTVPRGFMAWLDTRAPIYRGQQWRIVGRIYHDRSTGHAIRRTAIFERVGRASGFATSNETAEPEVALVSESADQPSVPEHAIRSVSSSAVERLIDRSCAAGKHGPLVDRDPID